MDDIENQDNILDNLNGILDRYKQDFLIDHKDRYFYTLISNDNNIKYCKNRTIHYETDERVFLIDGIRKVKYYKELYTYNLFTSYNQEYNINKININPFKSIRYYSIDQPCIFLDWEYDIFIFTIDIKFILSQYSIEFFIRDNIIDNLPSSIGNILLSKHNGFVLDKNNNYFINNKYTLSTEKEMIEFIEKLMQELNCVI